jgi:PKD repeat protein
MFSAFMITAFRLRSRYKLVTSALTVPAVTGLALSALSTVACDKVPLLAPTGSTIVLTAGASALPSGGKTTLTAQVLEAPGTVPHSGTQVTFTTTLGTITPAQIQTDINGRVVATFDAGNSSGTATITAASGGASTGSAGAVKILVGVAAVGTISVSATPSTLSSNGGSATVSATVRDINGNSLAGVPVSFSTDQGTLSTTSATTDQSGLAQVTITTSLTATITASAGGSTSSTPGTGTGTGTGSGTGTGTTTTPAVSGTAKVTVTAAPTLVITPPTTPPSAGLAGSFTFAVTVPANGAAIKDVSVNWGDGQTQDLGAITGSAVVSHVFRSAGTYTVTGTLTDASGNTFRVSTAVTVNPTVLAVTITPPSTAPSAGLPASFTFAVGTLPTGDAVQNVTVDWGDGQTQALGAITGNAVASHVYKTAGSYVVMATVTDAVGNTSSTSTPITVIPVPRPTITITPSPVPGHVNTAETFNIQVTVANGIGVTSTSIDFGDGTKSDLGGSTSASVSHVYTNQNTYTVSVTVVDSTGQTTIGTLSVSIGL